MNALFLAGCPQSWHSAATSADITCGFRDPGSEQHRQQPHPHSPAAHSTRAREEARRGRDLQAGRGIREETVPEPEMNGLADIDGMDNLVQRAAVR